MQRMWMPSDEEISKPGEYRDIIITFGGFAKCSDPSDVVVVGNCEGGDADLGSSRDDGLGVRARITLGFPATKRSAIMVRIHL